MMTLLARLRCWRGASSHRNLFLFVAILLIAQSAMPVSLMKNSVEFEISFSAESSALSESSVQILHSQLPCIKSLVLEAAYVETSGDNRPSTLDGIGQMTLAAERANVLRSSLRDLGVPESRIYTKAQAMVAEATSGRSINLRGGTGKIEYIGTCRAGAIGKPECDRLCKSNP